MTKALTERINRIRRHFIMGGGFHGCLFDQCSVYDSMKQAVESATDLYELSRRQAQELRRTGSVELKHDQGAEYCEITECNCTEPWTHDDGILEDAWITDHPSWGEMFLGRLSWTEGASAFYITDHLTNREVCIGDGVDLFTTEAGNPIRVSTPAFYRAMNRMVRDQETLDAYFNQDA